MASYKAGSFFKSASTGAFTQDVAHNLGETPKALIFFTAAETTGSAFRTGLFPAIGFVDDDRNAIAFATTADHNAATSNTARRVAAKALTIITTSATVGEFDISAWDSTNFTVSWTTATSAATWVIGFI